jgi:hypothetical protein
VERSGREHQSFPTNDELPLEKVDETSLVERAPKWIASEVSGAEAGEAERLVGLIAQPDRLRVVAALALGASTVPEIRSMTHLQAPFVEKALARLINGDLVARQPDGSIRLLTEELLVVARRAAWAREATEEAGAPASASVVLRRFFRGGRLLSIPTTKSKRMVVLDYLVQSFEPGRRYPERAVNEMLSRYFDDVASLRRYLVDEGLMERAEGYYWRAGGTFEV